MNRKFKTSVKPGDLKRYLGERGNWRMVSEYDGQQRQEIGRSPVKEASPCPPNCRELSLTEDDERGVENRLSLLLESQKMIETEKTPSLRAGGCESDGTAKRSNLLCIDSWTRGSRGAKSGIVSRGNDQMTLSTREGGKRSRKSHRNTKKKKKSPERDCGG